MGVNILDLPHEVYVDDFIVITNDLSEENLTKWSRAILHGIHSVFPAPTITGHEGGDPVSIKKLQKEEGRWEFEKEILGWVFNGKDYTLYLPHEKSKKLTSLLKSTKRKSTVTLNSFQKIVGKLVLASIGIPKGASLLPAISKRLQTTAEYVTITQNIRQSLNDWRFMLQLLKSRPTSVLELTPKNPCFIGYIDACNTGVGGGQDRGYKVSTSTNCLEAGMARGYNQEDNL